MPVRADRRRFMFATSAVGGRAGIESMTSCQIRQLALSRWIKLLAASFNLLLRDEGKSIAITSYILIIGVLIAMSMNAENKNSFASFHIRQALGLSITFISLALIISPFDSFLITFPIHLLITLS